MEAMGDRYRRRLLFELQKHNPQSDDDTQQQPGLSPEFDGEAESTVQSMMYHSHLPKLEELGYIYWDREAGTISKGPEWNEIAPFVQLLHEHGDELPVDWL